MGGRGDDGNGYNSIRAANRGGRIRHESSGLNGNYYVLKNKVPRGSGATPTCQLSSGIPPASVPRPGFRHQ
jgi:hypothetical protein